MQALIIIDMQMEMQHRIESGLDHVNPKAGKHIAALAAAFRGTGLPIIHVRHQEAEPASAFHPDGPGFPPMACAEAKGHEAVFIKRTSSAFASTDLAAYLAAHRITDLVVAGAIAGFCVNSTVRAGADLGFRMTVARDAVIGFALPAANLSAQTIFDVTMAHLEADFARLADTSTLLGEVALSAKTEADCA
ncbi:isochorismatase family protein [Paracoccus litorisediminis]|uniref:Isochorismatase family protein n=1 Tax=Paracoccus litorisediminis TaxID=2006130 RepID=A0A844HMS2_9RHOB|nr:isochorismatase family protein [Paracoccus litorisediminis]MTH59667.1 isochorismatase family protein [Paracoccus litorisediminis]